MYLQKRTSQTLTTTYAAFGKTHHKGEKKLGSMRVFGTFFVDMRLAVVIDCYSNPPKGGFL